MHGKSLLPEDGTINSLDRSTDKILANCADPEGPELEKIWDEEIFHNKFQSSYLRTLFASGSFYLYIFSRNMI